MRRGTPRTIQPSPLKQAFNPRKIIQISSARYEKELVLIFALCDDGTLWCADDRDKMWELIPNVPQENTP